MTEDTISSRHMLPAADVGSAEKSRTLSVRVCIDQDWASSTAGQLLVSALINLLCRQEKIVGKICITSPDVPLVIKLPFVPVDSQFPGCLKELAEWAVSKTIPVFVGSDFDSADYTIIVGEKDKSHQSGAAPELCVYGDGWRAWAGMRSNLPNVPIPMSTNPLGPFLAAALASGEVFKFSRGILRGKPLTSSGFSLWTGAMADQWADLQNGPELNGCELSVDAVHIVGAGAVGNDFAYIMGNAGLYNPYLIVIDHDSYDIKNLNRCLLAGHNDINAHKVDAIERALNHYGVPIYPFFGTIRDYLTSSKDKLRSEIKSNVDNFIFRAVASCVDRGDSRQDIQNILPDSLIGGSTLNLTAKSNTYNLWPGAMCLGCFNVAERDGEKWRTLEVQLKQMTPTELGEFAVQNDMNLSELQEYLFNKKCGSIGEAALKDFAVKQDAQFSAGFISLGAAVLLSASLLKQLAFAATAPSPADETTLNFLNGGLGKTGRGFDSQCELQCSTGKFQKNKAA